MLPELRSSDSIERGGCFPRLRTVAHRLSTIRRVNKVVVMDGGRVTECGSPEELLARGGYFARGAGGQVALA